MTLKQLQDKINEMLLLDPSLVNLEVDSEGCDCIEPAVGVMIRHVDGKRRILVARGY